MGLQDASPTIWALAAPASPRPHGVVKGPAQRKFHYLDGLMRDTIGREHDSGCEAAMLKRHVLTLALIAFGLWTVSMHRCITEAEAGVESPLRAIRITIPHDERAQFVNGISRFATANALEIRVSQPSPDQEDTYVQMWRRDVRMLAVPVSDPDIVDLRYDIAIYLNGDQPLPMTVLDDLVDELRDTVSPIENATFAIFK